MNDVSTKLIIDLVRFLELRGFDRIDLLGRGGEADSASCHERLLNPKASVSWPMFTAVLDGLQPYFPDDQSVRDFFEWSTTSGAQWVLATRPVAQFFSSPSTIYRLVDWGAKICFPALKLKFIVKSSSQIIYDLSLNDEEKASELFFRMAAEFLVFLPTLIGFKPSKVKLQMKNQQCSLDVAVFVPSSQAASGPFSNRIPSKIGFGASSLWRKLKSKDKILTPFVTPNERWHLESLIAERTVELAEANARMASLMENVPDSMPLQ